MKNQFKKAYTEIFEILNAYKDVCIFDIDDLKRKSEYHLFGIELKEVYGLNINPRDINSLQWLNFGEYSHIGWWGQKYNRTISWPNDGNQPEDELLLAVNFPTGPFIFAFGSVFDQEYPKEFFQRFWNELKSYNPDYIDDHNNCLYWKIGNANKIFNSFDDILERYYQLNKEDKKQREIKKLKEQLSKLEAV